MAAGLSILISLLFLAVNDGPRYGMDFSGLSIGQNPFVSQFVWSYVFQLIPFLWVVWWLLKNPLPVDLDGKVLFLLGCAVMVPFFLSLSLLSSDIYSYISYGRLWVVHGLNPFLNCPADAPDDIAYPHLFWKYQASIYGPVWISISALFTLMARGWGDSINAHVYVYKFFSCLFHLGNGVLIWSLLKNEKSKIRWLGVIVYFFNPFSLVENCLNAHNEVFVLTLILLGFLMDRKGWWQMCFVCLSLAALAKFYVTPIIVLYMAYQMLTARSFWHGLMKSGVGVLLVVLTAVLSYWVFWDGYETIAVPLRTGPAMGYYTHSLTSYFVDVFNLSLYSHLRLMGRLVKMFWFVSIIVLAWRSRDWDHFVMGTVLFFFFFCYGVGWFQPWYAVILLGVAVISSQRQLMGLAVFLSLLVPFSYVEEDFMRVVPLQTGFIMRHTSLVVFGLPAALGLSWIVQKKKAHFFSRIRQFISRRDGM